ncbi:hypothetical protein [Chryseobacterium sp. 3008163]|uniref:hypothetical protein n=1 Tax=Chryseobacterium sp. 3008163 TaxID=2478663 RepID=UPI000F0CB252|nr:hypothetical protein [Chryseobacterium sp. 3008163]AYM99274.1 hypothetical protein EAG08_02020 [Chryseobacterium sp. 3008163]
MVLKNFLSKGIQNNQLRLIFCTFLIIISLLASSCIKNDEEIITPETNGSTLACKKKPSQISFGNNKHDIKYNSQDQPFEVATTIYNTSAPNEAPIKTIYTIEYNLQGRISKVSTSKNNQPDLYYVMEYNADGKLFKQSEYNPLGNLITYTISEYDNNSLKRLISHKNSSNIVVTTIYQYTNGNLTKKSIQNLYDVDSNEFYNADFTYNYYLDKENKIKPYFEGTLGLLFISNVSVKKSLQYLPDGNNYQLFYAQESSSEKKMLKNIEVIAHRYNTSDTTNINYSYEYDNDGFPTWQKGIFKNITRRYVPTPFGGSILLTTPHNSTFESTLKLSCN